MKKIILILMFLLLMNFVSAEIGISNVATSPEKALPGERVNLIITLENNNYDDIKDISVKLDLNNVPFATIDSATEQLIDEIENDDSRKVIFNLITLPDAEPKIYKIPVKITYNNITKDSLISIFIESKTKLDLVLENSEIIKVNDKGKIIIKLVNLGTNEIKSLRLVLLPSLDYEILSPNTLYISKIDVEDFETAEFTIISNVKNTKLNFNLGYKDNNNKEYAENKELRLNVYSLEDAEKLGLIKKNYFMQVGIIILIIIILIFIYRKLRRKKNAV